MAAKSLFQSKFLNRIKWEILANNNSEQYTTFAFLIAKVTLEISSTKDYSDIETLTLTLGLSGLSIRDETRMIALHIPHISPSVCMIYLVYNCITWQLIIYLYY